MRATKQFLTGVLMASVGWAAAPGDSVTDKVEAMMVKCRSQFKAEDFGRASECVRSVLELEPIHDEANQLKKQIEIDKGCKAALEKGQEQAKVNLFDEALAAYVKITPQCSPRYFQKALDLVKDPAAEVKKQSGSFCQRYFKDAQYAVALKECEVYMRLECQTMNEEDVAGPPGLNVKLEDGVLKPTEWRPSNPLQLAFMKTRKKLNQTAPWVCPVIPVLRSPLSHSDQELKVCKERYKAFYPHPAFAESIGLYMDGKPIAVFSRPLQDKIVAARGLEHLAKDAINTVKELSTAYSYLTSAETTASSHRLVEAAEQLRKGVEIDRRITLGQDADKLNAQDQKKLLERCASSTKKFTVESFQLAAYRDGKELADRNDFRAACKLWKLGADFGRTMTDLLRALDNCTGKAIQRLSTASTCAEYKLVLDFAVEGDGNREKVMARTEKMNCDFGP